MGRRLIEIKLNPKGWVCNWGRVISQKVDTKSRGEVYKVGVE